MCVNWKKAAALGLAVLIGGMMPMSTMLAAEDSGIDAESVSGNGVIDEEENAPETVTEIASTDLPQVNGDMAEAAEAIADLDTQDDDDNDDDEIVGEPKISITRGGAEKACPLGGAIAFEYTNNWGTPFEVSVSPSSGDTALYFLLDGVTGTEAVSKTVEQLDSLGWSEKQTPPVNIKPLRDGNYVLYVKVVQKTDGGQEQTCYARSCGIVVDTVKPKIKEAVSGEPFVPGQTYPSDTKFVVEDANLDIVKINEQAATPLADGTYQVAVQEYSTSCVIRATDKAGNEETCSISVNGSEPPKPDTTVISESKEYSLKAGVKYHLAAGTWKVGGDNSVYPGDNDFYVKEDGTYQFSK